jgi:cytochrome b pre-mRNA-processing protein 3
MSLGRLFAPRPAVASGRRLYAAAVAQARQPAFYETIGAPDTPEGRFELYTLHVVLLLHRLKGQGPRAAETGQALFDAYVRGLDDALREMGVGDLSVGKKMRKLGEAFYGRAKAYDQALEPGSDRNDLRALIGRTLDGADAEALARYAAEAGASLAAQAEADILEGEVRWPTIER